jgi:hypothetical protein
MTTHDLFDHISTGGIRHTLDLLASMLWFVAWATFAAILFITSTALLPFILVAFLCGRLSRR